MAAAAAEPKTYGRARIPKYRHCCGKRVDRKCCGCVWDYDADWSRFNEWSPCNMIWACAAFVLLCVVLPFITAVIEGQYAVVQWNEAGLPYSTRSGQIEERVLSNGRYWMGANADVHIFPLTWQVIDLAGDQAVVARAQDGQQVRIEATILFSLEADKVLPLFRNYKLNWATPLRTIASTTVRDTSMLYRSSEFFDNRTAIEAVLLNRTRTALHDRHVTLRRLYIRNIGLPETMDNAIRDIAQRTQDATLQEAELAHSIVEAETDRLIVAAEAERTQLLAVLERNITQELLEIDHVTQQVQELTEQMVAELRTTRETDEVVYRSETEGLLAAIAVKAEEVTQQTLRRVAEIEADRNATLSIYTQETENARLAIEAETVATLKKGERLVAEVHAATEEMAALQEASHAMATLELEEVLEQRRAAVESAAVSGVSAAWVAAHAGTHPDLLVAHYQSDAAARAQFVDMVSPAAVQALSQAQPSGGSGNATGSDEVAV